MSVAGSDVPAAEAEAARRRERERLRERQTPGTPEYNLWAHGCECGRDVCDH
ncbi:hypothetical protein SEA_NIKAO_33 [Mycobacterium phage Nikao]|nr:hypothetical protein SEA_NIKAO_33 [Mycobacterium phage Nikao]